MTLEALQKKLKIMTDLKEVVEMMKMLSSVQLGTYEKMTQKLVGYQRNLHLALQAVAPYLPPESFPKIDMENGQTLAIVLGTDTGLVGGFNKEVAAFVLANASAAKVSYLLVGRRLTPYFPKPLAVYPSAGAMKEFSIFLSEIVHHMETFVQTKGQKVVVFYRRLADKGQEKLVMRELLPFPKNVREEALKTSWGRGVPLVPEAPKVWMHLRGEYLKMRLLKALVASQVAEHHQRMLSMQQAEKNITEELENVNLLYQQERQNVITEELIDIVSGAEVLKKKMRSPLDPVCL